MRGKVAAGAALATLGLGLWVGGDNAVTGPDRGVADALGGALTRQHDLLELFVRPTEPSVLLPLIALMTLLCALRRAWRAVLLCVAGTALPMALNSWVLKPLFDRRLKDYLAYPSGHTVGLVAALTVLVLLARPGTGRLVAIVIAVCVTVVAGIGLVGLGFHYPADVAGGALFALATVSALSLALSPALSPARSGTAAQRIVPSDTASRARAVSRLSARRYFFRYPPCSISSVNSADSGRPEASTGTARS